MKKRRINWIIFSFLFFVGLIPLVVAIIPPNRHYRSLNFPSEIQNTNGIRLLPVVSAVLDEPAYFRAGINEVIRLMFIVKNFAENSSQESGQFPILVHMQLPFLSIDPSGQVLLNLTQGSTVMTVWDITAQNEDKIDGTLWVYARLETENIALLAVPIKVSSIFIFGLPLDLAAFLGCVFSLLCLIVALFINHRIRKLSMKDKSGEKISS
jgi:hypothetical protein